MGVLEKIECSADIKRLDRQELDGLCKELREYEIECISKTGGHLASNLGAIELTVALHRVYDTSVDRIIFDVGHQSYAHKIITGRREAFRTLRSFGGLSGFPKPYESNDDAFVAGHASNSISVALGMARARTIRGENYSVACVIGDGALTGGLAYEGLSNAAASGEPLVVILNDNNMSINENVGGMATMLQNIRIKPEYLNFKKWVRSVSQKVPGMYDVVHESKEWLKERILPGNVFSEMGLHYLGPVDGHDIAKLESALRLAKDMKDTVILHVITKKGKGCAYAEQHPEIYHGIGKFNAVTGEPAPQSECFSDRMGKTLCRFAAEDDRLVTITAAMAGGTGTESFAEEFPKRFFDVGISEGHGVSMAGGMAKQGLLPVFAVYSSFLQRGFDMLIHDIALQRLHAVFCVDRAGLVGSDGETHHGVFDVSYLRTVPGMKLLCPSSFAELEAMLLRAFYEEKGPVAVRYPRGGEGQYRDCELADETGVTEGTDVTLVCYGTMIDEALDAEKVLRTVGISAELIKLGCVCPNEYDLTLASLAKTRRLIVAEEVCAAGCVGMDIAAAAASRGVSLDAIRLLNLGDGIVTHGSTAQLRRLCGIDARAIVDAAREMYAEAAVTE